MISYAPQQQKLLIQMQEAKKTAFASDENFNAFFDLLEKMRNDKSHKTSIQRTVEAVFEARKDDVNECDSHFAQVKKYHKKLIAKGYPSGRSKTPRKRKEALEEARGVLSVASESHNDKACENIANYILELTQSPKEEDLHYCFYVLRDTAIDTVNLPHVLEKAQQRCVYILEQIEQKISPEKAVQLALKEANSFIFKEKNAPYLPLTILFAKERIERMRTYDPTFAINGSTIIVKASEKVPFLYKEAQNHWHTTINKTLQTHPHIIEDFALDQLREDNNKRWIVRESSKAWKKAVDSIFSKNPVHGIGVVTNAIIHSSNMHKTRIETCRDEGDLASLPQQAELEQISAIIHYAADICSDLCKRYKLMHPLGSAKAAGSSYSFDDGAKPLLRYKDLNLIKGFRSPNIAFDCLVKWHQDPNRPPADTKTAWTSRFDYSY